MNKYQRLIIIAGVMNALLILLFPPFSSQPLARGMFPGFDGFYPLITHLGKKPVFTTLLSMELMFVGINTLAAWLALQPRAKQDANSGFHFVRGIALFVAINLLLILAFPPFEPYRTLLRSDAGGFDSFYFIFGRRSQPPIFWPLLYLEIMLVAVNALGLLLLFGTIQSGDGRARSQGKGSDGLSGKPGESVGHMNGIDRLLHPEGTAPLGRKEDRRKSARPFPMKEDRRTGSERRS